MLRRRQATKVVVQCVTLEPPTEGEWCHRCLLPSGVTVRLAGELDGNPWGLFTLAFCRECHAVL